MLYQVSVAVQGTRNKYVERVIEAPAYETPAGNDLYVWADKWAEEQSVIWGFKEVEVIVSRLFPMEIREDGLVTSQINSILFSWKKRAFSQAPRKAEPFTKESCAAAFPLEVK